MTNTDVQLLVAQARAEADNPAFKVREMWRRQGGDRGREGAIRLWALAYEACRA